MRKLNTITVLFKFRMNYDNMYFNIFGIFRFVRRHFRNVHIRAELRSIGEKLDVSR